MRNLFTSRPTFCLQRSASMHRSIRIPPMRAAVFNPALATPGNFVQILDVPTPTVLPDHVLLRVLACGVCRTDLHIVERDLPPLAPTIIPGHQIVGEIIEGATP